MMNSNYSTLIKGIGFALILLLLISAATGIIVALVRALEAPSEISSFDALAHHEISQITREEAAQTRGDQRVGAAELPKTPIKLILTSEGPCVRWESGYLDNGDFTGYIRNTCSHDIDYYQLWLIGYAPDGTVVQSNYDNTAFLPAIEAHQKAEIHSSTHGYNAFDDRIVTIKAKLKGHD